MNFMSFVRLCEFNFGLDKFKIIAKNSKFGVDQSNSEFIEEELPFFSMKTEFDAYRRVKEIFETRISAYKSTLQEDQALVKQDLSWNHMS